MSDRAELSWSAEVKRSGEKYHYSQTTRFVSSDPTSAPPPPVMFGFSIDGRAFYRRQVSPPSPGVTVVDHQAGAVSRKNANDPLYLLEFEGAEPVSKRKTPKEARDGVRNNPNSWDVLRSGLAVAEGRETINGFSTIRIDQMTAFHRLEQGKITSWPLGRTVINNPDGTQLTVGPDDWGKPGFPAKPREMVLPATWYVDPQVGYLPRRIVVRDGGNTRTSDIFKYREIAKGVWFPIHGKIRWCRGDGTLYRELELTVTDVQIVDLPAEVFGCPARERETLYDSSNHLRWEIKDGVPVEWPIQVPSSQPAK
ncbi:MAG: hypothetical protein HY718_15750 [Planctomycetes bacterium]|nr:hypothetical protein [Planctomycetota bacterium]